MIVSLLFTFFLAVASHCQNTGVDRWLVELKPGNTACLNEWWSERESDKEGTSVKPLPVENWYVVVIPSRESSTLKNLPCISRILVDQKIEWRDTRPNDPAYINQADMELIDMPEAWDISKGGVTADGDTIVVAVIDDGFQLDHEDLVANVWHNFHEIPNDDIDNDANGYVDDFNGLYIADKTDNHPVHHHGTSVAGIIGAKGNNGRGVTGVNWHVKLMLISGADFESELIEAYEYVLAMRKKYSLTNGTEGAFVVATNLSAGINNALAIDHPLWCGMYDKLGDEGILNVVAAPNANISVDVDGDMPTTCTSPYMIAVANVDLTDTHLGGYGTTSIDIAAPGHGTITTSSINMYKEFPGTSASAPHVTGAIALMYSTPCTTFLDGIDINPKRIAEKIRDIIFQTGQDNNSLDDLIRTGKRLQVDAAMMETIGEGCGSSENEAVKILSVSPNPPIEGEVNVYFEVTGDTATAYFELYTVAGAQVSHFDISGPDYAQGFLKLDTQALPPGIYLIALLNKKEKHTIKVFIY